jgi:hypothetical protein
VRRLPPEFRFALLAEKDAEAITGYTRDELEWHGVEAFTRTFADGRREEALRVPIGFVDPEDASWPRWTLEEWPWLAVKTS